MRGEVKGMQKVSSTNSPARYTGGSSPPLIFINNSKSRRKMLISDTTNNAPVEFSRRCWNPYLEFDPEKNTKMSSILLIEYGHKLVI